MIRDTKSAPVWTSSHPKIDPNNPGNVGSPMKGEIIEVKVAVGDPVEKGQVVAIISAMKMEMAVQVNYFFPFSRQLRMEMAVQVHFTLDTRPFQAIDS